MSPVQAFFTFFGGAVFFSYLVVGAHPTKLGLVLFIAFVVGAIAAYGMYKVQREEAESEILEKKTPPANQ